MFQFPGLAPFRVTEYDLQPGFPIRTSPDRRSLAAPRGLSQLATSFIAGSCLGIHHCALSYLTDIRHGVFRRISSLDFGLPSLQRTMSTPRSARLVRLELHPKYFVGSTANG